MRLLLGLLLGSCLASCFGWGELLAQSGGGVDTLIYFPDPKSKTETTIKGTVLEESPGGVKFKTDRNEVKMIPGPSIVWITYKSKSVDASTFREGHIKEDRAAVATKLSDRKSFLQDALDKFQSLLKKIDDNPNGKRFIEYKIADIRQRLSELDPRDKNLQREAIEALNQFTAANLDSWEIVPSLTALAQLQERSGNIDGARKAHESLSRIPGLPQQLKRESELQVLQLLLRSTRFADAESWARDLQKSLSPNDSEFQQVSLYLLETQIGQNKLDGIEESLKKSIENTSNSKLKALGHCLLGDYYRLKKQDENAFWEYLKVDLLYGQEKEETARSLYWLSQLFESVRGSKQMASQSRTRLLDNPFAGTVYQKKALADKPATP